MNNPFLKLFDDLFLPPPVKLLDYNKTHIEMLQRKNFGQFGSIEIFVMCFNMTEFANTWEVLGLSGKEKEHSEEKEEVKTQNVTKKKQIFLLV